MNNLVITTTNCITAVGHDGLLTAAAARAGLSRFHEHDSFLDQDGNPVTIAPLREVEGADPYDTAARISNIATTCLKNMLNSYFSDLSQLPARIRLFMGVPATDRPGIHFENYCADPLKQILNDWTNVSRIEYIPKGNASLQYAVEAVSEEIAHSPDTLCIVGGIDSLLQQTTLDWLDQTGRLKSISQGRHQGLIAGEAVGFVIIEDIEQAARAGRPVLARIISHGLAEEPSPRASGRPSRNDGLTAVCHAALHDVQDKDIQAVFGDLNGEKSRAMEWSMADMRCFKERCEDRSLWHPADCYGDIGAASGVVLANMITQGFVRGWLSSPVLMVCSDDHGACGAMVLDKG